MIRNYWNEDWKDLQFDDKVAESEKFKISNYGRIKDCRGDEEKLVTPKYVNGYEKLTVRLDPEFVKEKQAKTKKKVNKFTTRYIHKLVAEHFLEKEEGKEYVIHLDYHKKDNKVENLKWATKREKELHQFSNPEFKNIDRGDRIKYSKLTEGKVKILKKKLLDPNRRTRLRILAKQFGVSEMQLYRIKTGENWGHVTID
ncbi:NUMOD4 motif-containing protein [Pustulibacterium marinum]|uniref:NUMOD4 motif-containing protein n=1 Tax=Pustulibacterium marinum TaxID=1224947 RepID=A0A1I7GP61_9FLAO|nr:HNH endonuclease [Pustulibacterium marinum]SFU50245.1 NUMOD4 motif-containing protein [Pustulibacterium marinum]